MLLCLHSSELCALVTRASEYLDAALACGFGCSSALNSASNFRVLSCLFAITHLFADGNLHSPCWLVAPLCPLRQKTAKEISSVAHAIWHDPGDIKSKDLLNGPGGEKDRPQLPLKFLKEERDGQNSKFDVEDANGTKWKAKLGIEAQPEVVATRLLWAIGYFTNENYFVPNLEVKELPAHLHRGQGHVISPGHLDGARLQRHRGMKRRKPTGTGSTIHLWIPATLMRCG